jgi:hypothetical protein
MGRTFSEHLPTVKTCRALPECTDSLREGKTISQEPRWCENS